MRNKRYIFKAVNKRVNIWAIGILILSCGSLHGQTDPGAVNLSDREAARTWFNTWWPQTYGAPMGFTGNVATGVAGDVSQAYKNETLLRLNMYRRMAGEQPVTENPAYDVKSQAAAVLCAANDALSHSPPTTWKFYNAVAAEGCQGSDLAGIAGPTGVFGFMLDSGSENAIAGHRIQLLDPAMQVVGTGNSPAAANATVLEGVLAVWNSDPSRASSNLQFTDPLLVWPAKGFIPYYLIPGRWSVVLPDDALLETNLDISAATVSVTKAGQPATVSVVYQTGGGGLAFTLDGTSEGTTGYAALTVNGENLFLAEPKISADVTYHVTIGNIKVRATGALYNGTGTYAYDVTAYDPAVATVIPGEGSNLINISTRSFAGAGSSTQIAGFIINGASPRKVLIRAGGPYLTQFSVSNVLADPVLNLFAGNKLILSNDDWGSDAANVSTATTKVGAMPFAVGSADAAIVATLNPGVGYTAQVSGKGSATGNAIVEVYDADDGMDSKLINISTRSFVGTGSSIQIGGFILRGTGPQKVLIRAGGTYLTQFGVTGVLPDPVLTVFNGQTQIATNDDWGSDAANVTAATQSVGTVQFASGSTDSALVLILDPNLPYTAQVSGKSGATGNAIIEIYQLP